MLLKLTIHKFNFSPEIPTETALDFTFYDKYATPERQFHYAITPGGLPIVCREGTDQFKKNTRVIVDGKSYKFKYSRGYVPRGRPVGQKYAVIPGLQQDTDLKDPQVESELKRLCPMFYKPRKTWKRRVLRDDDDESDEDEEKEEETGVKTEEKEMKTEDDGIKKEEETEVEIGPQEQKYADAIVEMLALLPRN